MFDATNKYFDKTVQIIITKSGKIGFNVEHSTVDGTSISTLVSYVSKGLMMDLAQTNQTDCKPIVERKSWIVTEEIEKQLRQLKKNHQQQKKEYFLLTKTFTDFGADEIKKMNLSPDAFFHMALQLAQYRTYGQFRSVYEPVSVRFFYEGRTECARATSLEKCNLVNAIENGFDIETLYSLMQVASVAHTERIKDCQRGFGIERHLYGLEQMYYLFGSELGINNLPEMFRDEGYVTMRHDFISTSGMAYENAKYRMFAPVVKDGHGLAYFLLENTISINLSSFTHNEIKGKQLINHIVEALSELRDIANSAISHKRIS